METTQLKELAKKVSNDVLLNIIAGREFPDDELVIFRDEVKRRGLEAELNEEIKIKELNKSRIVGAVKTLPNEDLLYTVSHNLHKFTEDELIIFKNEVKARALEGELAAIVKAKEADALEFEQTVLDPSKDLMGLVENFNAYNEKKFPDIARRAREDKIKKTKNASIAGSALGVILLFAGVALTIAMEGGAIFYGAILAGTILIARSVIAYLKT
jgi:hypothetical protein